VQISVERVQRRHEIPAAQTGSLPLVNILIEISNQLGGYDSKRLADSQQSRDCNWTACFYLLPMPHRETEAKHVFLRIAVLGSQASNSLSQRKEKFPLIHRRYT
jgi:hypothetical protein